MNSLRAVSGTHSRRVDRGDSLNVEWNSLRVDRGDSLNLNMVRAHEFHCKRQWRSSELVTHQHNKIRINRTRTRIRKRTGIGLGYESALSRLPDVYRLSESRADDAVTPNTNKVYCACSS